MSQTAKSVEKGADKPKAPARPASTTSVSGALVTPAVPPRALETYQPAPVLPIMTSQGADPVSQAQRPWPGPPVAQSPLTTGVPADAPKAGQDVLSREAEKQWQDVVVPTESVLGLQLESSISSAFARIEDRVDARVTRDVRVGRRVAIPAGTRAIGSVVTVDRGGRVKERAKLGIRFNTLILPDASRVNITTDMVYREGRSPADQSSAKIGGAAIGGAIIGAIIGGGKGAAIGGGIGAAGGTAAAMNGARLPVVLQAGTTLSVRTQAPITLTIER